MKMIQPSLKVPPQLALASRELLLAQIVIFDFERAASDRATWKLESKSFEVPASWAVLRELRETRNAEAQYDADHGDRDHELIQREAGLVSFIHAAKYTGVEFHLFKYPTSGVLPPMSGISAEIDLT